MNKNNKAKQVARAEKLIAKGWAMSEAAEKVGVHTSSISNYRMKAKREADSITVSQYPKKPISRRPKKKAPAPGSLVAFVGTPEQVIEAVRNVSG